MSEPISLTDLRASIATLPADRQVILRADELVALVDAIEAAMKLRAANEPPHEGWNEAWFELRTALARFTTDPHPDPRRERGPR